MKHDKVEKPSCEKKKMLRKVVKKVKSSTGTMRFKRLAISRPDILHTYLRHDEINQYLDYLERRYTSFVKIHSLGLSYECRELKAIEIDWCCPMNLQFQQKENARRMIQSGTPSSKAADAIDIVNESKTNHSYFERNIVFIESGTHGREWITISTALNCIYQLTEKSFRHIDMLRKMRFFILPVSNPDGYEYSRTKNRRWRKNRRPTKNPKNVGTDINRNFDFNWEAVGGTTKPNRNTYKGEKPFSEPETRAIRKILKHLEPKLLFFLSLHSYAQCIMYPWGYCGGLPDGWQEMQTIATTGRNAIKQATGRRYRTGSIANLTKRKISGSVIDYVYGVIKVPFALVMELPASDLGFQPPPESISPLGHESWFGIKEMCKCSYGLHLISQKKIMEQNRKALAVTQEPQIRFIPNNAAI